MNPTPPEVIALARQLRATGMPWKQVAAQTAPNIAQTIFYYDNRTTAPVKRGLKPCISCGESIHSACYKCPECGELTERGKRRCQEK